MHCPQDGRQLLREFFWFRSDKKTTSRKRALPIEYQPLIVNAREELA